MATQQQKDEVLQLTKFINSLKVKRNNASDTFKKVNLRRQIDRYQDELDLKRKKYNL